ncbi:7-deoxyloganetin glucosyltransferase-like [Rhododendron vialii]|uniref:7-deoxyloganetin glucosyltransferase-like n=1 Tax=Rhododendron vialii TaxID=182163 RepID=UPI00265EE75A|nr:7-deoxyloganetin glucosyltransferase-like [Rhododendron vialii]
MEGDEGKAMKRKAMEWKKLVVEATSKGRLVSRELMENVAEIFFCKIMYFASGNKAFQASVFFFEPFEALEHDVFEVIKPMFQHVYAIGPLQMLLNSASTGTGDHLESVSFNQRRDGIRCLEWLDSMKPNSVVYISFGDLAVMTPQQLCEFAWGICNGNQPFLWIITPDFAKGQLATLPLEFLEKTNERGLIATWGPQEQVLAHPSVGVFVSHF